MKMRRTDLHAGLVVLSLAAVLVGAGAATAQEKKPVSLHAELERKAFGLHQLSMKLYQQGQLEEATRVARDALALCRQLFAKDNYPDGHPALAATLHNLGLLLHERGEPAQAEGLLREALAMRQQLYPKARHPDGHPDLATNLNNLGSLLQARGKYGQAESLYRDALAMRRQLYPKARYPAGHPHLALSLNNLGALLRDRGDYGRAEPLLREALTMYRQVYPAARYSAGHPDLATNLNNLGSLLQERGDLAGAEHFYRDALTMNRQLYPKVRYPDGHPHLAASLNNLGMLLQERGEPAQAEPLLHEALATRRQLYPKARYPDGHPGLAQSLTYLGALLHERGEHVRAESLYKDALAMYRQLYPPVRYPAGHPLLATTLNNLGALLRARGEYGQAETYLREALAMRQQLYPEARFPDGHAELATSLNSLGMLLEARGEYVRAESYFRDGLAMRQQLYPKARYPDGHPHLARNLSNLGSLLQARGEYVQAEAYFRDALAMRQQLYPKARYPAGHPLLANSLNNLGALLWDRGEYARAEPFLREALAMAKKLYPQARYPDGHPFLANSLNNLGSFLQSRGDLAEAEPFYRDALAMYKQLYPKERYPAGHPLLATTLNNLGALLLDRGEYGRAEPFYKDALAMCRQLYPNVRYPAGHPHLATCLNNLGFLRQTEGKYASAEPFCRDGLAMCLSLSERLADTAAEAEALNYAASLPLARDAYLSVTRGRSNDAAVYDRLWPSRSALTRLAERRHRDMLASRDPQARQLAGLLQQHRDRLTRLLWSPLADAAAHRQEVEQLTTGKEQLEKRLAQQLSLHAAPTAAPAPARPEDLCARLPAGIAFVDCFRYTHFDQEPNVPGRRGKRRTPSYVAFVLQRGRPVQRVELGPAAPIDFAAVAWWQLLSAGRPERRAATVLQELVWHKLRRHLPVGLHTLYLAPDGELTRLPWTALPGFLPGTVLLEETALALVPHGPFLLERLADRTPRRPPGGQALVLGGVHYQSAPVAVAGQRGLIMEGVEVAPQAKPLTWSALPGTDRERHMVAALARQALGTQPRERSGAAASTAQVVADLPAVRYAHLATHGFFADAQFQQAARLRPELFQRLTSDRQLGARSPLTLSGLVLAGANRTGQEGAPDRGIFTAEGIVGLRLEDLELAVLSACETGLGTVDERGEGVFGLQRAFHIAGCRQVIASLWQVEDEATAALMALFYRNLWREKQDALQALRQAQLYLYRNPQAIPALAKVRSADFTVTELPKVAPPAAGQPSQRAPVRQWAAFTFSGVVPPPAP
jgi:CHAT domain-containing protein/tetratricopeptide (TPR) repeat protein